MALQQYHPSVEELEAFSIGQLPTAKADAVELHVGECDPCCETLMGLSTDDTFLGLLKETQNRDKRSTMTLADQAQDIATDSIHTSLAENSRYEIVGLIARGGMGEVFKAKHRMMDRTVALKVINGDLMRNPEAVERFRREVKTAAQVSHANIVAAYDAEEADGVHFLVMEYVDGINLADLVKKEGRLSVVQAVDFVRQAALGLQHAHEMGMVHRDLKPHNLMLTPQGTVKILDFGLASLATTSVDADDSDLPEDASLTVAGTVMGTPDYIAPEQAADARAADVRSDIYSLGATLHYLLTGQPPFAEGSVAQRLRNHAETVPASVTTFRDDIPPELPSVIDRMLAKDPDGRFQSPQDVADALVPFVGAAGTDRPDRATQAGGAGNGWWPPRKLALAACASFGVLLAGLIYLETDNGTLVIESFDEQVNVTIWNQADETGDKYVALRVVDTVTGSKIVRLPSGDYKVSLGDDGNEYELNQSGFTLKRGGDVVIKVSRIESAKSKLTTDRVPLMTLPTSVQQAFMSQAMTLSPDEAKQLQKSADENPADFAARLQLLAYYGYKTLRTPEARAPHLRLVQWIVKNYPESYAAGSHAAHIYPRRSPEGFTKVKKLWLENAKTQPQNVPVLRNAAKYFLLNDRKTAEDLLKQAQAVEPENEDLAAQLGRLYKLDLIRMEGDARREQAAKAMSQFLTAVTHDNGTIKIHGWLAALATMSVEAGKLDQAKRYANQLLKTSYDGNAIHHAHLALGRVALRTGDLKLAKTSLLNAAKVSGGSGLTTSGPNMSLAQELLKKGEYAVVLEYFEMCGKFWKNEKLQTWTREVEREELPNFGANLAY